MRLYHFTSQQFGLEAIRDCRLKISRINEINDPFEFLGLQLDRDNRRKLKKWKDRMADNYGMICMSGDWQHPLLWGHYADRHRGLCLGFNVVEDGTYTKVDYSAERLTLSDIDRDRVEDLDEGDMRKLLFTKFKAWEYESEYRTFTTLVEKDPVSDLYFVPFSENLKLAQVIVGERSSITRGKLADVLGKKCSAVTSFKARAGFKRFKVEENKNQKAWK